MFKLIANLNPLRDVTNGLSLDRWTLVRLPTDDNSKKCIRLPKDRVRYYNYAPSREDMLETLYRENNPGPGNSEVRAFIKENKSLNISQILDNFRAACKNKSLELDADSVEELLTVDIKNKLAQMTIPGLEQETDPSPLDKLKQLVRMQFLGNRRDSFAGVWMPDGAEAKEKINNSLCMGNGCSNQTEKELSTLLALLEEDGDTFQLSDLAVRLGTGAYFSCGRQYRPLYLQAVIEDVLEALQTHEVNLDLVVGRKNQIEFFNELLEIGICTPENEKALREFISNGQFTPPQAYYDWWNIKFASS